MRVEKSLILFLGTVVNLIVLYRHECLSTELLEGLLPAEEEDLGRDLTELSFVLLKVF